MGVIKPMQDTGFATHNYFEDSKHVGCANARVS